MKFAYQVFLILGLVASSFAQTATLSGQVTDESGGVVPGAKVIISGPRGAGKSTNANDAGRYSFSEITAGNYTLQASAPQLVLAHPTKITLRPGAQALDLVLKVATKADTVTVEESNPGALSTDASSNASALVLKGDDLQALSDDLDDLAADLQALAGPSAGPNGGSIFVDGFSGGQLPAKESIREIRINQNPFSPEYDKLGYGKIEIFTKPGSDKYHGTAQWNYANDFWNTRNPYSPSKAPFLLNEFEGNAGGPLTKRSSFTLDAQRNMVDNGSIVNAVTVNRQTFAIQPLDSLVTTPGRFTNVSPRVDYQLGEKQTLMFRYGITHSDVRDNGIGAFDLTSRGYHSQFTNQTVQAADTLMLGTAMNEIRFQYYRSATQSISNSLSPTIQVLQSFNDGGSQLGRTYDTQNSFELQDYVSKLKGAHSWRLGIRLRGQLDDSISPQNFNGTFTFGGGGLAPVLNGQNQPTLDSSGQMQLAPITSIESFRRTLLFQQLNYTPDQIRLLGGGATQFSISTGAAELSVHQMDAGFFAGDEWRVRPNLTLDLGLRYETQTNIRDRRDFAPRVAIAWAPGSSRSSKTVVRAGFGMFYDRFSLANTLAAQRFNGVVQQQFVVTNPDFFPNVPSPAALAGFQSTQVVQEISSRLRAPYLLQTAFTVERQLARGATMAVTYTNSHGLHVLRSEDINAPLPGTYNPNVQNSGVFPLGHPGAVNLMESAGIYNQNQLIANVNSKINSGFSVFGFYVYNRAMSNTDGIATFPSTPYSLAGEYGPASTDVHHRVTIGGSINLKGAIRISPFLVLQSGAPFDITTGNDLFGTTMFNARPGIANDPSKPGLILTKYGLLDPNPSIGEELLPRNYGRGPGQINMNLRIAKTIGFGREKGGSVGDTTRPSGTGAAVAAATGRGLGGLIGSPSTSHRFNLSIGLSIRNLFNHTNPGPIIGNITSPYFGLANQVAGAQNGEGFYETANNRRLESQIKFTF